MDSSKTHPFVLATGVLICYIWCILWQRLICLHGRGTGAHPPKVIPPDLVQEAQLAPYCQKSMVRRKGRIEHSAERII